MFKLIKFIIGLVIFLIISVIIFAVVIIVLNRGNKPKSKTTSPSYTLGEGNTLTVNVDVKDSYVVVKKSKDGKVNFNYYASQTRTFEESAETDLLGNVTLTLKGYQTGKWYNRLFLTFKTTKVYGITIEVPDEANVNVKTDNGNIRFKDISYASTLTADTTNGGIFFENVTAQITSANTVNGNIETTSTTTKLLFYARTRKGNVKLNSLTSLDNIDVTTDSGKIDVDINNTTVRANVKLHSGKGNIGGNIRILTDAIYKINAKAHNGKVTDLVNSDTGLSTLDVTTDNGDITLKINKVLG